MTDRSSRVSVCVSTITKASSRLVAFRALHFVCLSVCSSATSSLPDDDSTRMLLLDAVGLSSCPAMASLRCVRTTASSRSRWSFAMVLMCECEAGNESAGTTLDVYDSCEGERGQEKRERKLRFAPVGCCHEDLQGARIAYLFLQTSSRIAGHCCMAHGGQHIHPLVQAGIARAAAGPASRQVQMQVSSPTIRMQDVFSSRASPLVRAQQRQLIDGKKIWGSYSNEGKPSPSPSRFPTFSPQPVHWHPS